MKDNKNSNNNRDIYEAIVKEQSEPSKTLSQQGEKKIRKKKKDSAD